MTSDDPLVFLPEMMCDARLFAPQIEALSRSLPVTHMPLGKHATIGELADWVLASAPDRFALSGLGFGGCVAMEVARRAPDRVMRLALMNTSPLSETPTEAALRDPRIARARAGRLEDVVSEEFPADCLAPGPDRLEVLRRIRNMAMDVGPETYVRQSQAMQKRPDQQATLRKLRMPTLLLCGEADTLYPTKRHEFMASLIPNAKLRIVADAGHFPTLEKPEPVIAALRDWLGLTLLLE